LPAIAVLLVDELVALPLIKAAPDAELLLGVE
jgi:hypothetical protein